MGSRRSSDDEDRPGYRKVFARFYRRKDGTIVYAKGKCFVFWVKETEDDAKA